MATDRHVQNLIDLASNDASASSASPLQFLSSSTASFLVKPADTILWMCASGNWPLPLPLPLTSALLFKLQVVF